MNTGSSQAIAERAQILQDHRHRFEALLSRAEAHERSNKGISVPEFEAFGWCRLGEFLDRFEESVNSPLLEGMRQDLEGAGISLDPGRIERLKAGLAVRQEGLIEITLQAIQGLKSITLDEIRTRAEADLGTRIERGEWDTLIGRTGAWCTLETELKSIATARDKKTRLYNAVVDRALEEGASIGIVDRLSELEEQAFRLGGEALRQRIRFEAPESSVDPMDGVETNLSRIASKKEDIRRLQGEAIDLEGLMSKSATLKDVIRTLTKRHDTIERALKQKHALAQSSVDKHNNLASLLGRNQMALPDGLDLKSAEALIDELQVTNATLLEALQAGLTSKARVFIEHIIDGRLPPQWDAQQTFSAIQELLGKGFLFEVKRREG